MTTKNELARLFNFEPDSHKIVGYAGSVVLSADETATSHTTAATFNLLDPKSKERTDKWLFVFLSPGDAMRLAKTILAYAERNNWPRIDDGGIEIHQTGRKDKAN